MQAARSAVSLGGMLRRLGLCVAIGSAIAVVGGRSRADDSGPARPDRVALGYEIFNREWLPDDPRSHGGDGLGPVYNDTSCVACHNAGGSGGAGPVSKNIDILSASRAMGVDGVVEKREVNGKEIKETHRTVEASQESPEPLADLHAGFRTSRTVVLHKFGTDPNYDAWRSQAFKPSEKRVAGVPDFQDIENMRAGLQSQFSRVKTKASDGKNGQGARVSTTAFAEARIEDLRMAVLVNLSGLRHDRTTVGGFLVSRSQRNPTPLFGLGLIDAIPDAAIEKLAMAEARTSPETQGPRQPPQGRPDRPAGLEGADRQYRGLRPECLRRRARPGGPRPRPGRGPAGPEIPIARPRPDAEECAALVAYVRSLPAPVERRSTDAAEAKHIEAGKAAFAGVGCANCHTPKLGDVEGIYSDLLLHDMGSEMGDDGSYDIGDSDDPIDDPLVAESG